MNRLLTLLALATVAVAGDISFAPLLELDGGRRRAFGPFFESGPGNAAVHPFWSRRADADTSDMDVLWPLYTRELENEREQQSGLFGLWRFRDPDRFARDDAETGYVIPFWYAGETADGTDYAALWPFGGTVCGMFGIDRAQFLVWPVYSELWRDDAHTVAWFWPIYSRTTADGFAKWRVFPLYGNREDYGKRRQRFYLWPFIHTWESLAPDKPGHGFFILPLYGRSEAGDAGGWTFLWPFFSGEHTKNASRLHAPWPFFVRSDGTRGPRTYGRHYWPFFGENVAPDRSYKYVIWPIGHQWRSTDGDLRSVTTLVVPVWVRHTTASPKTLPATSTRLWPLAKWRNDGDRASFQALALWPLPQYDGVVRNWEPLWTLYANNRTADTASQELLWGVWQHRREADRVARDRVFLLYDWRHRADGSRGLDLLTGLVGYRRDADGTRLRAFWGLLGDK